MSSRGRQQVGETLYALTRSTYTYATHGIPLECDVYRARHYPKSSPVLLFFHSGGLVAGGRQDIPPWLAQTCVKNKWPLISPSYRLLPQVDGEGIRKDAEAAYAFANKLDVSDGEPRRKVIAAGASAGFFMATLVAHHATPKPLALLASSGIPTFRHPFFNSSVPIAPEPTTEDDVQRFLAEPACVGTWPSSVFDVDMVLPSGGKNPRFDAASQKPPDREAQDPSRGILYDYFVYRNEFLARVGMVDPGFDWAADKTREDTKKRLQDWPLTTLLQGDADDDVDKAVCASVAELLGNSAVLLMAKGGGHRFGRTSYLEDEGLGMDEIRSATRQLENNVDSALSRLEAE